MKLNNLKEEVYSCHQPPTGAVVLPAEKPPFLGCLYGVDIQKAPSFANGKYAHTFSTLKGSLRPISRMIRIRNYFENGKIVYETIASSDGSIGNFIGELYSDKVFLFDRYVDAIRNFPKIKTPSSLEVAKSDFKITKATALTGEYVGKLTLAEVNNTIAIVNIVSVHSDKSGTFEVLYSPTADLMRNLRKGFGSFTADCDGEFEIFPSFISAFSSLKGRK